VSDSTLDTALRSWVPVPAGSDFPIQNLPYGVFRASGPPRIGVAIGDHILDLATAQAAGAIAELPEGVFEASALNRFLALGRPAWRRTREQVSVLLRDDGKPDGAEKWLHRREDVAMELPVEIGDYVDFYSSLPHATNVGMMFRPDAEPLLPNWRHLPVAYHGRASSVVVSGTPIVRPNGQHRGPDGPVFGPTERLDIEMEVGFFTGVGNPLGTSIPVGAAEEHIFGLCLVNDWSARDIQAWEYQPLGPFLGKSFATTVSPWIVTMDALAPFRVAPPPQDPPPLDYLAVDGDAAVDLRLEILVNGEVISRPAYREMYWTISQQLAHVTVNGTNVRTGDLYASGTVSGETPGTLGCLLEMTWNGTKPLSLAGGEQRTYLEDGDEVVLRGWCEREGATRIGFGECTGTVVPAQAGGGEQ
jgi:fumarylacetoacetase